MVTTAVVVNDWGTPENAPAQIAIDSALALAQTGLSVVYFCAVPPVDARLVAHPMVQVVCTGQMPVGRDLHRLRACLRGVWNALAHRLFGQVLRSLRPHTTVIHFHLWNKALSPCLLWRAAEFGAPVFLTAHEYYTVCPNGGLLNYPSGRLCRVRPLSMQCLGSRCDRRSSLQKMWRLVRQQVQAMALGRITNLTILAPSLLSREILQSHLPGTAICYLPNFVRHLPGATRGIPYAKNANYLFIGRLEPEKGIELFCQAVSELGLSGVAVGAAENPQEEARLRAAWPQITFTGALPWEELAPHVALCRALVFPSLWPEGMGLVPFEVQKNFAMPCIVARDSAPRQLVQPGQTGLLFRTGDVEDLKKALLQMQEDALVERITQNVAAADFSQYEEAHHMAQLRRLYDEAAKREVHRG